MPHFDPTTPETPPASPAAQKWRDIAARRLEYAAQAEREKDPYLANINRGLCAHALREAAKVNAMEGRGQ